jgi:hypothetical protein
MLKQITIITNPLEIHEYKTVYDVEDIRQFLVEFFKGEWPDTAKIYHRQVAVDHDVTPTCEREVEELQKLEGPFYVVIYPGGWWWLVVVVIMIAATAAMMMMMSKIPQQKNRNDNSPNNELSDRTNQARPNKRIPDIYGTVRSVPDLLALPYKIFEDQEEVEYAYMCIGRGYYDVSDVRDGETLISNISGASVEIFDPFTSPNSTSTPALRIGPPINEFVVNVTRSNSVNGQVLRPPNDKTVTGDDDICFYTPNEIHIHPDSDLDFTAYFQAGDSLTVTKTKIYSGSTAENKSVRAYTDGQIEWVIPSSTLPSQYVVGKEVTLTGARFIRDIYYARSDVSGVYIINAVTLITLAGPVYYCRLTLDLVSQTASMRQRWQTFMVNPTGFVTVGLSVPSGTPLLDLDGTYTILGVMSGYITLYNPGATKSDWNTIASGGTDYMSAILAVTGDRWVGPFTLETHDLCQVFNNYIAPNGLYKDNGKHQKRIDVTVELKMQAIDLNDNLIGDPEYFQGGIEGTKNYTSQRAVTLKSTPTFSGRCNIWSRRVTPTDTDYKGSVVDEIKWRDCYAVSPVAQNEFGNITTVHSKTYATAGALIVKDRKLNMLATRKLRSLHTDGSLSDTLYPTNSAADIIAAMTLDPHIGNRGIAEIDLVGIHDTVDEINTYFGTSKASEFNYTFDEDNMSYEESITQIAQMIHCEAYRFGNVLKLLFERETNDSVLLFNHRNKLPGTETRTISFGGNKRDNDGVELEYVNPDDDTAATFYVPEDQSAINPIKVEAHGIRDKLQARFLAYREYNKLKHQTQSVEFTATQEANLLLRKERILVADNTRPDTQDGQVKNQDGLTLTLSQPIDLTQYSSYNIFLQLYDKSVESIPVYPVSSPLLAYYSEEYQTISWLTSYAGSNPYRGGAFIYTNINFAIIPTEALLDKTKLYLKKVGSPTGSIYAYLYATTGAFGQKVPTGAPLATSLPVDIASLSTNAQFVNFDFTDANEVPLAIDTYYAVVVSYNGGNASNYLAVGSTTYGGTSGGNRVSSSNGSSWTYATGDMVFYLYGYDPYLQVRQVILGHAPRLALVTDDDRYACTTYVISGSDERQQTAFLVTKRGAKDNYTATVEGVNYDSRYYGNDGDYKNGVVDINGNLL